MLVFLAGDGDAIHQAATDLYHHHFDGGVGTYLVPVVRVVLPGMLASF